MAKDKFIIEPHFRLQEWVAEEKGYFKDEGLDYVFREMVQSTDGAAPRQGRPVGAMQSFEEGRKSNVSCACHWTVGVAASKGKGKLYGDVYSVSPSRHFRAAGFADQEAGGPRRRADLGRLPVRQPLRHHPGARALHAGGQDQPDVRRRHAVRPPRQAARAARSPASHAVLRAVLLRRAARLPQDPRQHLHDRHHDQRRSRPGGPAQVLPRAQAGAARHRSAAGPLHALLQERVPGALSRAAWTRGAGARASGWCSSPTPRRSTTRPSSGSPTTASSPTPAWARASYEEAVIRAG